MHALLASPLRYAGMPADRLWEMEDAQVNLGARSRPSRRTWPGCCVAEFALTYGNDWLVVPVDVPFGSLTTVESVTVHDDVRRAFPWSRRRARSVRTATGGCSRSPPPAGRDLPTALLIAAGAPWPSQDGPAVEEVLFLRDEMANLAWAVERIVQGPSGAARDRASRAGRAHVPDPGPVDRAELDYLLQTACPRAGSPTCRRTTGYRAIELVQGAMPDADGNAVTAVGQTSQRARHQDHQGRRDSPRRHRGEATAVDDAPGRRQYVRWTTRRVGVGRGEGASQLAFDWARPRKPKPND